MNDGSSPKLGLLARQNSAMNGLKHSLTHVDFSCLPASLHPSQPIIKLENHEMLSVSNSQHDAMLTQNVADLTQCLPTDANMLSSLTSSSLVGL